MTASQWLVDNLAHVLVAVTQAQATLAGKGAQQSPDVSQAVAHDAV